MNALRKIRNTLMWIAAYEIWRFNVKATRDAIRLIREHKEDDKTWGEAIQEAREHVRYGDVNES